MLSRPHDNPPVRHHTREGISGKILVTCCGSLDPPSHMHTSRHREREVVGVSGYTTARPDKMILDE